MKLVKRFGILSSVALLAGFCVAGAGNASAGQSEAVHLSTPAVGCMSATASYLYKGHHYVYVWHGKYFNHRRWHNNAWYYY